VRYRVGALRLQPVASSSSSSSSSDEEAGGGGGGTTTGDDDDARIRYSSATRQQQRHPPKNDDDDSILKPSGNDEASEASESTPGSAIDGDGGDDVDDDVNNGAFDQKQRQEQRERDADEAPTVSSSDSTYDGAQAEMPLENGGDEEEKGRKATVEDDDGDESAYAGSPTTTRKESSVGTRDTIERRTKSEDVEAEEESGETIQELVKTTSTAEQPIADTAGDRSSVDDETGVIDFDAAEEEADEAEPAEVEPGVRKGEAHEDQQQAHRESASSSSSSSSSSATVNDHRRATTGGDGDDDDNEDAAPETGEANSSSSSSSSSEVNPPVKGDGGGDRRNEDSNRQEDDATGDDAAGGDEIGTNSLSAAGSTVTATSSYSLPQNEERQEEDATPFPALECCGVWGSFSSRRGAASSLPATNLEVLYLLFQDIELGPREETVATIPSASEMASSITNDAFQQAKRGNIVGGESPSISNGTASTTADDGSRSEHEAGIGGGSSNPSNEFVDGLDDIDKFFQNVDAPDELDVGAGGSSIQEVLMGQGSQILLKRIKMGLDAIRKTFVITKQMVRKQLADQETGELKLLPDFIADFDMGRLRHLAPTVWRSSEKLFRKLQRALDHLFEGDFRSAFAGEDDDADNSKPDDALGGTADDVQELIRQLKQ